MDLFWTHKSPLFWTFGPNINIYSWQFDRLPSLILKNLKCANTKIYNIWFGSGSIFFTNIFNWNQIRPPHNCMYCIPRQQYFQTCFIITKNLNILRVLIFFPIFCFSKCPTKVSRISGRFRYVFSIIPEILDAVGTLTQ